jgi:hypothetical protein
MKKRNRVLIFDNGEEYSDHSIDFVDCGPFSPLDAERLFRLGDYVRCCWSLIAVVDNLDWRDPKALTTLSQIVEPVMFMHHERALATLKVNEERLKEIGVPLVKKLVRLWHRIPPSGWETAACMKLIEEWLKSNKE